MFRVVPFALLVLSNIGEASAEDAAHEPLRLELTKRLLDRRPQIEIEAGRAELMVTGESVLSNGVRVNYEGRSLGADEVRYDPATERIRATGNVVYEDARLAISGTLARFDQDLLGGAFSAASFELKDRPGRGSAGEIRRPNDDLTILSDVHYTTCPVDNTDWELIAPSIEINEEKEFGVARSVRVDFQGIPILYAPYLSFPLSDARKTGVLVPDIGTTDRGGYDVSVPWYINIAPNQDATLTPRFLSQRGLQLQTEYRYLLPRSSGELDIEYLPDDNVLGRDRSFGRLQHRSRFSNGLRLLADINIASDGRYFEDLGNSLSAVAITHLERRVDLSLRTGAWNLLARVQEFQTLDDQLLPDDLPYAQLPQLRAQGFWPGALGLEYRLDSELAFFDRDTGVTGSRLNLRPEVAWPLSLYGASVTPRVAFQHTRYELGSGAGESSLARSAPVVSLDARAVLERELGGESARLQTLEPRLLYTYIPYRDQSELPVFDTGRPDLNFVQLFREDRFVGPDRLGDTEQLSIGLSTRLMDSHTGSEFFSATLGQIVYFGDRDVTLPGETRQRDDFSDFIAETRLRLSDHWNADLDYQWDPQERQGEKAALRLQYQPVPDTVLNLGYRFRRDELEQSDISFAMPIGSRWDLVGRWNYSIQDRETLERFIGVEYESCCWAVRLINRNYVSTRAGETDTTWFVQIELKGLTSVGTRTEGLLERGILGYSLDRN